MAFFYYMRHLRRSNTFQFITCKTFLGEQRFDTDIKKQIVKNQIAKAIKKFHLHNYAYSIVSNHIHQLFFLESRNDLPKIIQIIQGGSAYELNKILKREGGIWDRYYNRIIWSPDKHAIFNVIGYIIGNPLKHGIVKSFQELKKYKFCSYHQFTEMYGDKRAEQLVQSVLGFDDEENIEKLLKYKK